MELREPGLVEVGRGPPIPFVLGAGRQRPWNEDRRRRDQRARLEHIDAERLKLRRQQRHEGAALRQAAERAVADVGDLIVQYYSAQVHAVARKARRYRPHRSRDGQHLKRGVVFERLVHKAGNRARAAAGDRNLAREVHGAVSAFGRGQSDNDRIVRAARRERPVAVRQLSVRVCPVLYGKLGNGVDRIAGRELHALVVRNHAAVFPAAQRLPGRKLPNRNLNLRGQVNPGLHLSAGDVTDRHNGRWIFGSRTDADLPPAVVDAVAVGRFAAEANGVEGVVPRDFLGRQGAVVDADGGNVGGLGRPFLVIPAVQGYGRAAPVRSIYDIGNRNRSARLSV